MNRLVGLPPQPHFQQSMSTNRGVEGCAQHYGQCLAYAKPSVLQSDGCSQCHSQGQEFLHLNWLCFYTSVHTHFPSVTTCWNPFYLRDSAKGNFYKVPSLSLRVSLVTISIAIANTYLLPGIELNGLNLS